jgi:protein SCO1/2
MSGEQSALRRMWQDGRNLPMDGQCRTIGALVRFRKRRQRFSMKALLLFSSLVLTATCLGAPAKSAAEKKSETCEVGLPPGKYSDKSIYRVPCTWTNDDGASTRLANLAGKPVVMALIFTNCQHSCPLIVRDMKAIQGALSTKAADKTEFLLVSIDPERDTPEVLKAFRKKHRLTGSEWTLLTGKPECVKQLAEKVGFVYSPGSKTQFAHSLMITVLNAAGDVAHQQAGLGADRSTAVATLEKLAAAKPAR